MIKGHGLEAAGADQRAAGLEQPGLNAPNPSTARKHSPQDRHSSGDTSAALGGESPSGAQPTTVNRSPPHL